MPAPLIRQRDIGASYDELADRLNAVSRWIDNAYVRLRECRVGSREGAQLASAISIAERTHSLLRVSVHNHPDAPPQG